eukprot:5566969-Prymnesium_polylepis.1
MGTYGKHTRATIARDLPRRIFKSRNLIIPPDTQEGAVPHQDRPAHIPCWSVVRHKQRAIKSATIGRGKGDTHTTPCHPGSGEM